MSKRFELRDEMGHAARNLADIEGDPAEWATWLVYMLECLESNAVEKHLDPAHPAAFETSLDRLSDAIHDRRHNGRW